ncbi:MAG: hypothetical protein R2729_03045 [Bryobacteraceae bacterium]
MALTLSELQARRDDIVKSAGITKQTFGDRSVEYGDAVRALAVIDREIATLSAPQESRVFTVQTKRGLE